MSAKERIHNPKTEHYYRIQQRNTSKHKKGQIVDRWHRDKK
jgi:hypothetical protein